MLWFSAWMILNIGVTMLNKIFFSSLKCPYPQTVTLVHMIFCAIGSQVALTYKYSSIPALSREMTQKLRWMSFLFVLNIVLGNLALNYCSIAFVQMIRCTNPFFTAIFAYPILGTTLHFREALSLLPVVVGAVLVCLGDVSVTTFGVILTLAGVIMSSLKSILTKVFLSGRLKDNGESDTVHPMQLLLQVSFLGTFELIPFIVLTERDFFAQWMLTTPTWILATLLFHGLMAFFLNQSNFEANRETSPLMMSVGGNIKQVVCIGLSHMLFHNTLTPIGVVGTVITIVGGIWHNEEVKRQREVSSVERKAYEPETEDVDVLETVALLHGNNETSSEYGKKE